MRSLVVLFLIAVAAPVAAQFPGQQPAEELVFPEMEAVKQQIAEARGVKGVTVPTAEERTRVVAKVNGEPVQLGNLLDEIVNRFSAQLIPQLLNQQVMNLETTRRKVTISDEEFADAVAIYLAQKKAVQNKTTLRDILVESAIGWDDFERLMADNAKIAKLVRGDLKLPNKKREPLNPLFVQIWAGQKMRGAYQVEMDATKLPDGVAGRISATRPVSDVLESLPGSGATLTVNENEPKKQPRPDTVTITPADGGWPRTTVPLVDIDGPGDDGSMTKVPVTVALEKALAGPVKLERYVCITVDGAATRLEAPVVEVEKTAMKTAPQAPGQPPQKPAETTEKVALAELVSAVANGTVVVGEDGTAKPADAPHPRFVVPDVDVRSADGTVKLAAALRTLAGKKAVAIQRVRMNGTYDMPDAPVTLKSMLDRDSVLRFVFGRLTKQHFDEALESYATFVAAKQALKANGVTVDEAAVAKVIAEENARYNNPFFNRSTILQALGKTEFEEDRRLWIGNGVDQIIGTDNSEDAIAAYYEKNILHFGRATVEASHILIDKIDPKTGKEDWAAAEARCEPVARELFGARNPRAVFPDLARRFSEDAMTAKQGGELGEFGVKGQMVPEFTAAAFALRPGEVSAPVKTVHGYHFILCTKRTPPDRAKNSLGDEEVRRQVVADLQQERRDAWLAENTRVAIERVGAFLPGLKEKP